MDGAGRLEDRDWDFFLPGCHVVEAGGGKPFAERLADDIPCGGSLMGRRSREGGAQFELFAENVSKIPDERTIGVGEAHVAIFAVRIGAIADEITKQTCNVWVDDEGARDDTPQRRRRGAIPDAEFPGRKKCGVAPDWQKVACANVRKFLPDELRGLG